jgi:signal transduction histidine kinase
MGNITDTTPLEREIVQLVATSKQPDELLAAIAKTVGTGLAAVCCVIVGADLVRVFSWHNHNQLSFVTSELSRVVTEIFRAGNFKNLHQPLAINDLGAESWSQPLLAQSIDSIIILPAQLGEQIVGYLLLGRLAPNQWDVKDAHNLKHISSHIAIAIDKSDLYQKSLTLNHYETILPQLSAALTKNGNKEQFFELALSSTTQAVQADLSFILLLKYDEAPANETSATQIPKAKVTLVQAWRDETNSLLTAKAAKIALEFDLDESTLLQEAYQQAPHPLIINNGSDRFQEAKFPSLDPEFSSCLIVPLISISREPAKRKTVLGFLVFQYSQTRTWKPEELALVNWISTLTSTVIVQSETLSQVQTLVEERTAQLKSSLEVQAMLYEKTRQQLEQVRQAKKAREEFIDSISHELRTPLTAMNLAIRMLRQPALPDERRANYFNILEQQCNQEIALVNDLLDWGRLESKQYQVQLQTVNLRQLLAQLAQSFAEKWTHKGLTLELELPCDPIDLHTDQDILKRTLLELLNNAGKYSVEGSSIYLRVERLSQNQQITISVTNLGSCIPPDEIGHIFEPLHRPAGTARNAVRGTGLGLALVKSFVQHLHGAIEVSSQPVSNNLGCETCFRLTLPQSLENF